MRDRANVDPGHRAIEQLPATEREMILRGGLLPRRAQPVPDVTMSPPANCNIALAASPGCEDR
jgi:hypothetical protein